MSEPNPLLGFARGDENLARHLQDRFRVIRERSTDPSVRAIAGKVVRGETSPREAMRDPAFGKFLASSMQKGMQQINSMSEEERRQLAEQGEQEYHDIGLEKRTEPARDDYDEEPLQPDSWLQSFDDDR